MNSIFDSSSLSLSTKKLTKDEFIAEIVPKLQEILNNRFPGNPRRQRIRIYRDRINFAAPCCGDSAYDDSKKRGNIILEGTYKNLYKCHNCGHSASLYKFFKEYGESLSLDALDYIAHNSGNNTDDVSSAFATANTYNQSDNDNNLYDNVKIDSLALDREIFKRALGLEEVNVPNNANTYLVNRKQLKFEKFLYSKQDDMIFVLNLTKTGKIIGLQTRPLHKKEYKTYNLSKIYEIFLHRDDANIPDDINSLSMLFNILLVDYRQPVTIVEGPMDSFLIRNCVALCGGGKHMDFPFKYRFLYDSDLAGKKFTIEKLNAGHQVFLWSKYQKAVGFPNKAKWDINDLVLWANKNRIQLPKLDPYFSNDSLDLIDI